MVWGERWLTPLLPIKRVLPLTEGVQNNFGFWGCTPPAPYENTQWCTPTCYCILKDLLMIPITDRQGHNKYVIIGVGGAGLNTSAEEMDVV